jgi:hypothetical protein
MGTNYYVSAQPCAHCGRGPDRLHIGKSSGGWCFSLHVIPELDINSLDDWRREWNKPGIRIFDEYGTDVSMQEMEKIILKRSWEGSQLGPEWYRINCAEPGPNGLARHSHKYCVAHGDGTYDLISGEFC